MIRYSWKSGFSFDCMIMLWSSIAAYNLDTDFPLIYNSIPKSYFGYTVALHRNREGSIALVGAPKLNSTIDRNVNGTEIFETGALFRCDIPPKYPEETCHEVNLTNGSVSTGTGDNFNYKEKKDGMWLGVSLDIQPVSSGNDIVTCGHLWTNLRVSMRYLRNGVCFVINSDLDPKSVKKLLPLLDYDKLYDKYHYAYGLAGMSATFSEDGKHLLLGAPGLHYYAGGVISYPTDSSGYHQENLTVPYKSNTMRYLSYFGYSSTSGRFFDTNDVFFAVGAPRSEKTGSSGSVYIFKSLDLNSNELYIQEKKEGTQFGEYFGASVLGINLNGDSFTDLLVGAPFHSLDSGGDEGKVYVYMSNGTDLLPDINLTGGSKPAARFGTAIANAGDLNRDGYNDVAIGAPYEDKKGAVYIYHGSKTGINTQYVQKIEASIFKHNLLGFGIHISRGLDIDNNSYPDILVGAYNSSSAVLLRTRPVIHLFPKLAFDPTHINTNVSTCEFKGKYLPCLNLSACLSYNGTSVPSSLGFEYEIFVESTEMKLITPRGHFVQNGVEKHSIRGSTRLNVTGENCMKHYLYIKSGIRDIITPIQIIFQYSLTPPANSKVFNKSHPVIDPSSPTVFSSSVFFQTGCSKKDKCVSDLSVSAEILGSARNGQLTTGNISDVSLMITVKNTGEPAHQSLLLISLPSVMPSIKHDFFCSSSSESVLGSTQKYNASLYCELGNPLLEDREVQINIKLDARNIPTDSKKLDISFEVVTSSEEKSPADNTKIISLYPQAITDISITGLSSQEEIFYDEQFDVSIPVTHTYTVMNHGPSPVQVIDILLYVPTLIINSHGQTPFVLLTSSEVSEGKQQTVPVKCNDTYLNYKEKDNAHDEVVTQGIEYDTEPVIDGNANGKATDLGRNFEKDSRVLRKKRNADIKKEEIIPRKTISINCNNENVECTAIQCSAYPFTNIRKVAQISVSFQVNVTAIFKYLGPWHRANLTTVGRVSVRDQNVEQRDVHPDITEVITVFVHVPPPEKLAGWIVFVSIILGILLLIFILVVLIRNGFFKRKQQEKLKEMQNEERKSRILHDLPPPETDISSCESEPERE